MDKPIQKNPHPLKFLLAVTLLLALYGIFFGYTHGFPEKVKIVETFSGMQGIAQSLKQHFDKTGALPATLADLNRDPKAVMDAWGTSFRYEPKTNSFTLTSAGRDRQFGTNDDHQRSQNLTHAEVAP